MKLRKRRTSKKIGWVRINRSGVFQINSVTLAGPLAKLAGAFGYGVDLYRRSS